MNKKRTSLSIQERLRRLEEVVFAQEQELSSISLPAELIAKVNSQLADGQSLEAFVEAAVLKALTEDEESDLVEDSSEDLDGEVVLSETQSVSFMKKIGSCSLSTDEVQSLDSNLRPLLEYHVAESNWLLVDGWEESFQAYLKGRKSGQSLESWMEERKENDLEQEALAWLKLGQ